MKSKVGLEKLRGGYYTPEPIAQFICNWAIDINTKGILEPSCGDGVFLKEAAKKDREMMYVHCRGCIENMDTPSVVS